MMSIYMKHKVDAFFYQMLFGLYNIVFSFKRFSFIKH